MKNEIKIYTDGASRGNPGSGGWGAIIDLDENVTEIGGKDKRTTNNRMELTAVVESLEYLENKGYPGAKVSFFTDSSYVANGINSWINSWRKNNWKNKAGQEIANIDLWQKLDNLLNIFEVRVIDIEGHVGISANERADQIATSFADNKQDNLFVGKKFLYKVDLNNFDKDKKMVTQKSRKGTKAYSYLSLVDGELEIHKTWAECEKRVKGRSDVKFKKSLSEDDENKIKKSWGF